MIKSNLSLSDENIKRLYRIVLLKLKTCLVKNLEKDDIQEFEKVIQANDTYKLMEFANKKIPNFSENVVQEIQQLLKELDLFSRQL